MIYTPAVMLGRGQPIALFLDGKEITHSFYLDRRRRVIRRFKTNDDGSLAVDAKRQAVEMEEIRYGHRQKLTIKLMAQIPRARMRRGRRV